MFFRWKGASYVKAYQRSIHLANLGLIVFIAGYCADKLNLGEETQSGMAFIVKFCINPSLRFKRWSKYINKETIPSLLSIKCGIGLLYVSFFVYLLFMVLIYLIEPHKRLRFFFSRVKKVMKNETTAMWKRTKFEV